MLGYADRYIIRAIFGLSGVVGLGLVALYSFISFITEIDQGDKSLGVGHIFTITALTMPAGLYALMPLIAMLGTLLGVGQLAAQSELTALRAAGYSNLRIGFAAVLAGGLMGLAAVGIGESLAPAGQQAAERVKQAAKGHDVEAGVRNKPLWLRDGGNFYFIRSLQSRNEFADAEIYRFGTDHDLDSILSVSSARFEDGRWVLRDVDKTRFRKASIEVTQHEQIRLKSGLDPDVLDLYVLEADTLSAGGLLRLARYLEANGLDSSEQRLEFWRKLIAPLTVMAMVLFAVPFVFGPTRGGGAGQQLLIGVLVGVGFHLLNEVSANLGVLYGWAAPLSAGLPTFALMAFAVWRLASAR